MATVCPACNALFSGGDGATCPACGEALPASAATTHAALAPAIHGSAPQRAGVPSRSSIAAWAPLVAAAAALVPVSSFLGVRGWMGEWLWIWQPSMLANIVFTAGTMAAFMASVWLVRKIRQPSTAILACTGIGLVLHWIVYELSWRLVLAAGPLDEAFGIEALFTGVGFVAWVGGAGLFVAALAGGIASLALRQTLAGGAPAPGLGQSP